MNIVIIIVALIILVPVLVGIITVLFNQNTKNVEQATYYKRKNKKEEK